LGITKGKVLIQLQTVATSITNAYYKCGIQRGVLVH
jgi:hypothetical protein